VRANGPCSSTLSELVESRSHALMRGLRLPGHEAQLTQVIAAAGGTDAEFATGFVRAVLGVAAQNP
jgi:hypothetical protein